MKEANAMLKFTEDEIDALLFYQGSIENISDNKRARLEKFYSVNNAYNVLNVLLFPKIGNEKARIAEKRELNHELILHIPELLKIYCNIYSAMCKYTFLYDKNDVLTTRRTDRVHSIGIYEKGETCSFLSTTINEQADISFCEKKGLILLEVRSMGQIEHINLNKVLGDSSVYQEEEEILYAPFLHVNLEEIKLDETEKKLKDYKGEPPLGKYKLTLVNSLISGKQWENSLCEGCVESELYQKIINKKSLDNVIYVWDALKRRKKINSVRKKVYIEWKEALQEYLKKQFQIIKNSVLKAADEKQIYVLQKDISDYKNWTNEKRMEYEGSLKKCNVALSVIQPLIAMSLALSFIGKIEIYVKIMGIVLACVSMIIYRLCESLGLKGKVEQRTLTYLRLDELERDVKYELLINQEKEKEFIERFKDIIYDDDRKCESNVQKIIRTLDDLATSNTLKEEKQ